MKCYENKIWQIWLGIIYADKLWKKMLSVTTDETCLSQLLINE